MSVIELTSVGWLVGSLVGFCVGLVESCVICSEESGEQKVSLRGLKGNFNIKQSFN